ncbi:hypothetical protein [Haloterrigena alkaliphila]|uniref:CARDB protein n=1 Tax=Haloterrigena alkaliphila TaxID=2816475 RepID=A0A8A2VCQ1_9EURY|nr:hypothetical protein [Haloterrigena alkaliphila]QSW98477.1 hypothetical protein J0X25_13880 [Haloterrigena alkaliphila]
MNRRRFIAFTGGGIGTAGVGPATTSAQDDPALFEVATARTSSPVNGGDLLEVTAIIENVGDETGTTDVELIVGHTPEVEDSRTLTLAPGERQRLTLEFRAGQPSGGREEFPVRVDTGAHEASESVVVTADGGDPGEGVTFDACTQARLTGTFEDGYPCYASTIFYTESGVGNTIIEDGITVGEDVDAPFTGTIVVRISDDSRVIEDGDRIYVDVPNYGEYGTVLTGLTTDEEDYRVAGTTHGNPHAEGCLEEIRSRWEDAVGQGDSDPALFEVASVSTNSPVGPNELLEVSATIENVGDEAGTTDVELVVGHSPEVEDSQTLTLDPGESAAITLEFRAGTPSGGREEFPVRVDTGAHTVTEMVVVT